jgi:hypothetical protein
MFEEQLNRADVEIQAAILLEQTRQVFQTWILSTKALFSHY